MWGKVEATNEIFINRVYIHRYGHSHHLPGSPKLDQQDSWVLSRGLEIALLLDSLSIASPKSGNAEIFIFENHLNNFTIKSGLFAFLFSRVKVCQNFHLEILHNHHQFFSICINSILKDIGILYILVYRLKKYQSQKALGIKPQM